MDGSYSKRAVGRISASKKKPATAVKETAGPRDGTGQLCSRIGCCGRLNHNTKGTKSKTLEKPKPLKPSFRSSSSKETKGGAPPKSSSKFKTESSSVPNKPHIQEVNSSGSQTRKSNSESNSESNNGRRRRLPQGVSSSSGKGKMIIGASTNEAHVSDPKNSKNVTSSKVNSVSSVRTRKPLNLGTSKGSMNQQSSSVVTNMPHTRDLSRNGDHSTSDASTDRSAVGFANDNGRGPYNMDGIADLLLALDRYGHNEELTYQQLLEANLFLGGLNLFDQHRDMRLDIDNMSYEELLMLEEKMGTVSTALSAEELSKCIKTSIYEPWQLENEKTRCNSCVDDSKCSICQEEFVRGDEVGRLGCGHGYHTACINQWLGLKNWCPICKVSPTPA